MRCTLMRRYSFGAGAARQAALVDQPVDEFDGAQFRHQRGIEGDLVDAAHDLARRGRHLLAHQRIDLHDQHVLGLGRAEERIEHRIAEIAAVPIGHAVDLDRAEHRRQAGRGHHRLGGNLLVRENMQPPGLHIGGGDEDRPRVGAQALEIDEALDQILERIDVERIEIVGRKILRPGGQPVEGRRAFARQQREQPARSPRAATAAGRRRGSPRARNRRAACALRPRRRGASRRPASPH